jgi:putative thioredoxin
MSQSSAPRPRLDVRGAVDLSSLGRAAAPAPGGQQPTDGGGAVVDVTEATFGQLVEQSSSVPVVVALWASWSEVSQTVTADLVALAGELGGRFLLARVDADANPRIAQAFGAQSVPAVVAVLGGQPVPLFQGAAAKEDVRAVLGQLLQAAEQAGVTGQVAAGPAPAEPEEPPLPPLHREAYDAIDRGDLGAALDAYTRALAENPRDEEAKAGLAQVGLMQRTAELDVAAVTAAAQAGDDVAAQLAMADLELLAGRVEEAFARLVAVVRRTAGEQRETARVRLVDLLTVVGDADPRVLRARRDLASALY